MRTVWPMLWLIPAMAGTAAIAWRLAGREAALVALLLAVVGLPAFHQFRPGGIDHHNVQIALSLLASPRPSGPTGCAGPRWAAGAVTGLALAIGLECLPYLMVCAAAFACAMSSTATARAAARTTGWRSRRARCGFLVIVGPAHWMRGVCDAIAINWVALVVIGGLGLAARRPLWRASALPVRLACVVATARPRRSVLAIEPRCLTGPFAMMDPAVWPIWLAHVREMQPLVPLIGEKPLTASRSRPSRWLRRRGAGACWRSRARGATSAFSPPTAAFLRLRDHARGDEGLLYAIWLGMPLVAAWRCTVCAAACCKRLCRARGGLLLTPAALSIGAMASRRPPDIDGTKLNRPEREACLKTANYAPLAQLPAGLVAADIDFGPFLLALTPHSVLAAPYHRLSAGIIAAHEPSRRRPTRRAAFSPRSASTYVVTCGPRRRSGLAGEAIAASLWGRLAGR